MRTRLTLLLGGGGVGKTTLAAARGRARSSSGRRVALLGVDPARRLQSALAVGELPELGRALPHPSGGELRAAVLRPEETLRRWVADACPDDATRARLLENAFFLALADRLAAATDAIAAARAAEWAEREPDLDDLVVDTAPGLAAVELLARPEKILAFVDGRLIRWIRRLASPFGSHRLLGRGRQKLLDNLSALSGADALRAFGEFISLVENSLDTMVARLERARRWLRHPSTELVIVTAPRDDSAAVAVALAGAARALGHAPRLAVVNRALPDALLRAAPALADAAPTAEAAAFARFVAGDCRAQARVRAALLPLFPSVRALPEAADLDADGPARLAALSAIGAQLAAALADRALARGHV